MKKVSTVIFISLLSLGASAVGENASTAGSAQETCCKTGHCGNGMPLCTGISHKRLFVEKGKTASLGKKRGKAATTSKQ